MKHPLSTFTRLVAVAAIAAAFALPAASQAPTGARLADRADPDADQLHAGHDR